MGFAGEGAILLNFLKNSLPPGGADKGRYHDPEGLKAALHPLSVRAFN